MKIIVCPGIHTDGSGSTDLLSRALRDMGFECVDIDRPRNLFNIRWHAKCDADYVAAIAEPGDVLIGHSAGGLISLLAARQVEFLKVIVFAPAASARWKFKGATPADRFICIYTPHDRWIFLGAMLIAHPFGPAGIRGFRDPRVANIIDHQSNDHSDFFRASRRFYWAEFIAASIRLRQHLEVN